MIGISLCMIIKNEEDVIGRCLDSVKDIMDEIIIVDTGSTDSSKEIVSRYTDKIYDFKWVDDFSKARNFSFSKATKDYIMWLDADDVILEEDREKLKQLKNTLESSVDIVMMKYNISFDSNGNPTFSYDRERLLKRSKNYKWVSPIHEVIIPNGNVIYSDISISHKKLRKNEPERNLRIFRKMIKKGMTLDPRQQFYYGRELYFNGKYREAIRQYDLFLNSGKGWVENCINACIDLYNSYKLLKDEKKAIESLIRSLEYDEPRAEVCCELGDYFLKNNQLKAAIFWYKTASTREMNENLGGFQLTDCYGYIPFMQLCFCYDKLGDHKKAEFYNEKAGKIKPNDDSVNYNRAYFKKINM